MNVIKKCLVSFLFLWASLPLCFCADIQQPTFKITKEQSKDHTGTIKTFKTLNLCSQHLTDFTVLASFSEKKKVEWLRLSYNFLFHLPPHVFDGFSNLQKLSLENTHLVTISPDVFAVLPNLKELYLSNNPDLVLTPDIFSGLASLELLDLGFNNLIRLPAAMFSPLVNLKKLYLDKNKFTQFPDDTFSSLSHLEELYLNENRRLEITAGSFSGLTSLKKLDLTFNNFKYIPEETFASLAQLKVLLLTGNTLNRNEQKRIIQEITRTTEGEGHVRFFYNDTQPTLPGSVTVYPKPTSKPRK